MEESHDLVRIAREIKKSRDVLEAMSEDVGIRIALSHWSRVFANCLRCQGTLFFAGNGGSYADAIHLAAEFTGKMGRRRPPLAAHALGANGASMSAIGNDYAFEEVFAREFLGLCGPNSALLVLSTSGNSANIVRLVESARNEALPVLAFTGETGGALSAMCECVMVPSSQTERIQEAHILLGHVLCGLIEAHLAGDYFEWD